MKKLKLLIPIVMLILLVANCKRDDKKEDEIKQAEREILKESKTFCLAPWLSIHTWPDGKTYPCCIWNSNEPVGNINDHLQHATKKLLMIR